MSLRTTDRDAFDSAVRKRYASRTAAASPRTSIGAGRDGVVKINTSTIPDILKKPNTETRTSGDVSYDLSVLSDQRSELTEELTKLNNGTGRFSEEGKNRIGEIESELKSIREQEKTLDTEFGDLRKKELQALIDSGEYRKANFYDVTVNSFNQGRYNAKYGQESYKAMTGEENEKETYAEILAGEDYKYIPQSTLEKVVSNTASMLGQQFQQLNDKRVLNTGITGAATSAGVALAAGQAGPQIAAPEEVVTVPTAAMTGFVTGMNAGSAAVNFEIEAGLAYNEMIANGVSEETARVIALGVGGANAALEVVQLDELTDAFKITKRTGATENFAKSLAEEIVKRTGGVLKEAAQEVGQEGVTITGTQLGSMYDTGRWAYNSREVMNRLNDTAKSSVFSFGLLNLPADVVAMKQQLADMQRQKQLDDLAAVYEKNVGSVKGSDNFDEPTLNVYEGNINSIREAKVGEPIHKSTIDFLDENAVIKELDAARDEFVEFDHEESLTVTSDGKVWRVKGEERRVNPASIQNAGSDLKGSYSYHNHPTKETHYSFSADDVQFFFEYGEAYSKAADDQFEYIIIRTPDTLDVDPQIAYSRFRELYKTEIYKMAWDGEIDIDYDGFHEVMKRLSKEYGFFYERRQLNGDQ